MSKTKFSNKHLEDGKTNDLSDSGKIGDMVMSDSDTLDSGGPLLDVDKIGQGDGGTAGHAIL